MLEIGHVLAVRGDVLQRIGDHSEVPKAKEVHLQKAKVLAQRVLELSHLEAVTRVAHHGDDVRQRRRGHDHGARMHAPVALDPLEPRGEVDHLLDVGILVVELAQLGGLAVALIGRIE